MEPVGHTRVAPPLQRHEVDVDEAEDRERDADTDEGEDDASPPRAVERDEAPEDVRTERKEVVAERVQLTSRGRVPVEPRLRHEPVHDDDCAVGEGEAVGPAEIGDRPGGGEREDDRREQEDVLPGGNDVERRCRARPPATSSAIARLWSASPTIRTRRAMRGNRDVT